jgi:hypothetical protein
VHSNPQHTSTVQYGDVRGFLGEIETVRPFVRQGLVRLARLANERLGDANVRLNLVASAQTHDRSILMDVECGVLTGDPRGDGQVFARADALKSQVEHRCEELGLRVHPGYVAA